MEKDSIKYANILVFKINKKFIGLGHLRRLLGIAI